MEDNPFCICKCMIFLYVAELFCCHSSKGHRRGNAEGSKNPRRSQGQKKETDRVSSVVGLLAASVAEVLNLYSNDLHHYTIGKIQVAHGSSSSLMVNLCKL